MNRDNDDFDLLKELIGKEGARKLAEAFGGSMLYIPKRIVIAELHRLIKKEYKEGATYRDLRTRYGYSDRHIRNIIHIEKI